MSIVVMFCKWCLHIDGCTNGDIDIDTVIVFVAIILLLTI